MKLGSVNFYMFEGGTNFGFTAGRNSGNKTADVTSYDYDAPLTEDGQITPKYELFKEIISKYASVSSIPLTMDIKRKEYGKISCSAKTSLFDVLEKISVPVKSNYPVTMEDIGQNYGYILYRTHMRENEMIKEIRLEGANDRIQAYHNGEFIHTFFAENICENAEFSDRSSGGILDLLCENMGRENFGTNLERQRKGIADGVKINDHRQFGYKIYPLPLDETQINKVDFSGEYSEWVPAFYKFEFEADELCDTFLDTDGFGKGVAFINGFNLGRFWDIGPQKRLYIPAPLIKKGNNSIIIFETEGRSSDSIFLYEKTDLG